MTRLTIYDDLAGCYKIKPEVNPNVIQRLGKLESDMSSIEELIDKYNQGGVKDSDAWKELLELPMRSLEEADSTTDLSTAIKDSTSKEGDSY